MPNHHGSWHDVQAAHIALALNRRFEAREIVRAALTIRIGVQIQPDGSQPLELARTNPAGSSVANLEALVWLGMLAKELRVEWWGYASPAGASVAGAFRYLTEAIAAGELSDGASNRERLEQLRGRVALRLRVAPP